MIVSGLANEVRVEHLAITSEQQEGLELLLFRDSEIAKRRFPFIHVLALIALELPILWFIKNQEKFNSSIGLKLLAIIPILVLVLLLAYFFRRRRFARSRAQWIGQLIESGKIPYTEVFCNSTYQLKRKNYEYLVFPLNNDQAFGLSSDDFEFSSKQFPSTHFLVPPIELKEAIGNKIISMGELIEGKEMTLKQGWKLREMTSLFYRDSTWIIEGWTDD